MNEAQGDNMRKHSNEQNLGPAATMPDNYTSPVK